MEKRERALIILMRIFGAIAMLALPFIFIPYSWMNALHDGYLGLGTMPSEPIVGYLARSTSFFYFFHGALYVLMSFDLKRYRKLLLAAFLLTILFGAILLGVDLAEGMPASWTGLEGPMIVAISLVMLWLLKCVREE